MSDELLAQLAGPVAALGLLLVVHASGARARLAGLGLWVAGLALFVPLLVPSGHTGMLALAGLGGLAVAGVLATLFVRWPWAVAFLGLAAAPARIPVTVGDTSANLLLPLYAVVAGAALAFAYEVWRDRREPEPRSFELGLVGLPLSLLVLWFSLTALWTPDVRDAAVTLFFFVLPFGLLAVVVARLPWNRRALRGLVALLAAMAVVFAGVGVVQWVTRDVFWNPKVIVGNAYAPFYRVNSVFWDPSIYGRFLVVSILVALVVLLFGARRSSQLALAAVIAAAWVGLLFSFSQSSFAALVAGVALASVLAWRRRAVLALALAVLVMIPVGIASPALSDVRTSLFGDSAKGLDRATSGRFKLVSNGLRIAAEHPLVGVGVGGFAEAYAERLDLHRPPPSAASHNTPVTVVSETGVVGLALLAWLVAAGLLAAFRSRGPARLVGLAAGVAFAAIVVHSLFYAAFVEDPLTWAFLGLAAAACTWREAAAA